MRVHKRLVACAVAAGLATAGITAVVAPQAAWSHGAMQIPGSRTWLCYEDALTSTGQLIANNPACAAAIAKSGTTSLYNWFAVLRSDGAGRGQGFIPDGSLCSGGATIYDFSGYDLARSDWPVTHLTSDASMTFRYNKWAAHPGTFSLYITKDGWDPNAPLSWDELEPAAFTSATDPPSVGDPGSVDSYYYWTGTLPHKTGRHLIYSIWARSDSTETFYGCSDVVFDGGTGQVTGVGPGGTSSSPTASPTAASPTATATASASPTRSASASPSVSPTGGGTGTSGCTATYTIASSWSGAFQATVTVTNKGSTPTTGWTVLWTFANGETVTQSWSGTFSSAGDLETVKNVSWNGVLAANGSTSFGFLGSGTPATPTNLTCTST